MKENMSQAAQLIQKGELVVIPTETVYGLAASAWNADACAKIFELKQRPFFDPLIVHIDSLSMLHQIVSSIPSQAQRLMEKFWPGPLTLVLPKKNIPDLVTSGLDTVAVRMPAHPICRELITLSDSPLAAPSANRFGKLSPTTSEAVKNQFGESTPFILDGGPCAIGLESTILGFDGNQVDLLRPGGLGIEEIENVVGPIRIPSASVSKIQAPGNLPEHYAPSLPLFYLPHFDQLSTLQLQKLKDFTQNKNWNLLSFGDTLNFFEYPPQKKIVLSPQKDLRQAASHFFESLRLLDQTMIDFILCESFPDQGLGLALNDRLKRGGKPLLDTL